MAKAQGKKKNAHHSRGTNDAQRFAAIRWLAMKIEQLSIEILVTNRDKFDAVEGSLRDEVTRLKQIGRPGGTLGGDDCPEGYVLCRDGLCAPMCDSADTLAAAPGQRGRKR